MREITSTAELLAATARFKQGFIASDGSRVVNEAEAGALSPDAVDQEKVTVNRKTVTR